jgi:hypothetical protein
MWERITAAIREIVLSALSSNSQTARLCCLIVVSGFTYALYIRPR